MINVAKLPRASFSFPSPVASKVSLHLYLYFVSSLNMSIENLTINDEEPSATNVEIYSKPEKRARKMLEGLGERLSRQRRKVESLALTLFTQA